MKQNVSVMILETLQKLFERDLDKLIVEIEAYKNESVIWKIDHGVSNSAGNLALHLTGNLSHFVGAQLGNTGYVRSRDLEFSKKDIPKAELIAGIKTAKEVVISTLGKLTEEQLQAEFPLIVFGELMSTEYMLIHLTTHLSYHLGQINYHRRLLDM